MLFDSLLINFLRVSAVKIKKGVPGNKSRHSQSYYHLVKNLLIAP